MSSRVLLRLEVVGVGVKNTPELVGIYTMENAH